VQVHDRIRIERAPVAVDRATHRRGMRREQEGAWVYAVEPFPIKD
jgi:hypothetical protein